MEKKIYTLKEAMQILGVGRNAILNLVKTEGFPAFKMGGKWAISMEGLNNWIERQSSK